MVRSAVNAATLAGILLGISIGFPARARADVPEQVAAAVQEVVNELIGNEIDSSYVFTTYRWTDPPLPADCPDSVEARVDIVGFSFCAPADPWAAPTTAPERGKNAYGCANAAEVSVSLIPPGFRANVEIAIPYLFVEFRTTRGAEGAGDSTAVMGHGYFVSEAGVSVSMQCDLLNVEGCMRLAPLAPTASVSSCCPTGIVAREDTCLSPKFDHRTEALGLLVEHASAALKDHMLERMDAVNEALCGPAVKAAPTWAPVRPRSGSGG